jgi:FKBP-type peptidyl-prolyl cis-trans isomerase
MDNNGNKALLIAFAVGAVALISWAGWYENKMTAPSGIAGVSLQTGSVPATSDQSAAAAITVTTSTPKKTMDKLQIKDLVVGTGTEAKAGDMVSVQYVGTLDNGNKFDSSYDRNQPFSFQLGVGQVIQGWDQGVAGMKVGGKRELVIPGDLGYGANGHPPVIPPNATLHFTVELLAVTSSAQ